MVNSNLKVDTILQNANKALEGDLNPKIKNDLRKWISWVIKQEQRFDKGHITAYHYFISIRGFATFLKEKVKMNNDAIEEILKNNYCQVCLAELSPEDLAKSVCPSCRMPLSKSRKSKDTIHVPERRDQLSRFRYSIELYFRPSKIFSYFRYGIESWFFFVALFIITASLIGAFIVITLPKISYGNPIKQMTWMGMTDSVLSAALSGYLLLELIGFLFYSVVFYTIAKGSNIKLTFTEVFKISSVIIAPRMVIIPLVALINQINSPETYILDYNVSYDQARYLIFNITDFSGKFGVIAEFFSFLIIIVLVYYGLEYLWDFQEGLWLRITPLIFIALVFTFGIPFFI